MRQAGAVVKGHLSIPQRVVSIFDTGARPIRRGKARADTEFGRKVLIEETGHKMDFPRGNYLVNYNDYK